MKPHKNRLFSTTILPIMIGVGAVTGTVVALPALVLAACAPKNAPGPLFIMEKMAAGFNKPSGDWRYSMVMANGAFMGTTNGKGSASVAFCIECHASVAEDQDHLFFLPEEVRR